MSGEQIPARPSRRAMDTKQGHRTRMSVVVPTCNRRDLLRQCLTAVAAQDYPDYEVIVVDDGSTDGTGEMVQCEFPQVRYVRQEPNQGPAAARNRGIEVATGEIVAFTDDDCVPPANWLRQLEEGFECHPEAGAIGGIQESPPSMYQRNIWARYERFLTRQVYRVGEEPVVGWPAPIGSNNLAVRRRLLASIGGFDERFAGAAGEDTDLLHRLAAQNYAAVSLPVQVTHYQTYTWSSSIRRQIQRGEGAFFFQIKHTGRHSLARDVGRLLATPLSFLQHLFRYRSLAMAAAHTICGGLQTWGRIRAHGRWATRHSEQCWQASASPVKLRYLEQYAVGRTALDVGSGPGFYTRALSRRGFSVVAVDLQPLKTEEWACVQARMRALPFGPSFDTVLAFDVIEHEPDEDAAFQELRRVTGQRLILSVPNADHSRLLPYNLTYKHHLDKTHQREYEVDALRARLQQAGFRALLIAKEGPVSPAVLAEFVRPAWLRWPVCFLLKGLFKLKILDNPDVRADLYAVAEAV